MLRDQIRKLCLNVRRNQLQERMREILVIFSLVDVFHTMQLNPVRVAAAPARCHHPVPSGAVGLGSQPHPSQETNAELLLLS